MYIGGKDDNDDGNEQQRNPIRNLNVESRKQELT